MIDSVRWRNDFQVFQTCKNQVIEVIQLSSVNRYDFIDRLKISLKYSEDTNTDILQALVAAATKTMQELPKYNHSELVGVAW